VEATLPSFNQAICEKLAIDTPAWLEGVCGFVDVKVHFIARPLSVQAWLLARRSTYKGRRQHAIKFQAVHCSNGMTMDLYGLLVGDDMTHP
jgi:hypothetical protein